VVDRIRAAGEATMAYLTQLWGDERRRFWLVLAVIVVLAAVPRLMTYRFSLPYVDHPDEPNYYLAGQEARGLFDLNDYFDGAPPGYIQLSTLVQAITEPLGQVGMAAQVGILRLVAVLLNLGTLVLIALAAYRVSGPLAGLIAGGLWAISPEVLARGVLALPDPVVYGAAALAIWLAVESLITPGRASWAIASVIAGGVAVWFKAYIPLFAPGIGAALILLIRAQPSERRVGLRTLILTVGLAVVILLWLMLGVGFSPFATVNDDFGSTTLLTRIQDNLGNLLQPGPMLNNLAFAILPLGTVFVLLAGVGGLLALWRNRGRDNQRTLIEVVIMIALYMLAAAWIVAAQGDVDLSLLRYVIPVTAAAAVLVGIACAQIVRAVPADWQRGAAAVILLIMAVLVIVPHAGETAALVADRQYTDRRVDVRFWAEDTLEPGWVLVEQTNEKLFNHIWSGIPVAKWFDWLVVEDMLVNSAAAWREDRGVTYAVITLGERARLLDQAAGPAWLDDMLLLREFPPVPDRRGPGMAVYRLWGPEQPTAITFTDSGGGAIRLSGYDQSAAVLAPGETLTLRFYWGANQTPAADYSLFIHITPLADRAPAAQGADGTPALPERLTPSWTEPTETLISRPFDVALPPDLPPGEYRVLIGLYDYESGLRLTPDQTTGAVGALPDASLHLTTITVRE
jgi:4-amino-4-deoxy-L-arabinose transferase-like glycosyltransferase